MRHTKEFMVSLVLVLILFCSMVQSTEAAILEGQCGDHAFWSFNESTGEFKVTGSGPMYDYKMAETPWYGSRASIKSIIVEEGITRVGNNAFSYTTTGTKVSLADTVTEIGDSAFYSNYELVTLDMPGVKVIEDHAFKGSNKLVAFEWPKQLVEVGAYAFHTCDALTDVVLPDTLTTLGDYAFAFTESITEITLPESLVNIGEYVFDNCLALERVTMPDNMTKMGIYMFRGCESLKDVVLPASLTAISDHAFAECVNLRWIWIPNGVTSIAQSAFESATRLERILIPGTVKTIGRGAFYHCINLSTACYFGSEAEWGQVNIGMSNEILLDTEMEFDDKVYTSFDITKEAGCVDDGTVNYIASGGTVRKEKIRALGHEYEKTTGNTRWKCRVCNHTVTASAGTLGYGSCGPNLTWILSPNGELIISGEGPMVNFGGGRTEAPWHEFNQTIKKAVVEEGVTYLGEQSLWYSTNMTNVVLPDTMTEIGAEALMACYVLTDVTLPSELKIVGNSAFFGCKTLASINLSDTVEVIGEYAFYNCKSLEDFEFPKGLLTTGQWVFAYCDGLEEVVLPEKLKVLGDYAFDSCKGLKKADLPEGLSYLGIYAFRECSLLESVNIPTTITAIGQNTFDACTSLKTIAIPKNVTSIGRSAFYTCTGLTDVYIYSNECVIEYAAFSKCSDTLTIWGVYESPVQEYAQKNNIRFRPFLSFSSASLTLHNNLSINFKVKADLIEMGEYENPYVVFTMNGKNTTVSSYRVSGDYYIFDFNNIVPQQMNDVIYAKLHAGCNGTDSTGEVLAYSVANYCYSMLEKYTLDEYAEFRTLLVDLLNYGAAAQHYVNYKTNDLVNSKLTSQQKAWGTEEIRSWNSIKNASYAIVENPLFTWKSASLYLVNSVQMRFKISEGNIEGIAAKIRTQSGKEWEIKSESFEKTDGGYYIFFDKLNAGQMSEPVYVTIYQDGTAVSNTLRYSIETYAYIMKNYEDKKMVNLLTAMMKYGDSAYAYVN